jgi:ELWxxDGT repeat protein
MATEIATRGRTTCLTAWMVALCLAAGTAEAQSPAYLVRDIDPAPTVTDSLPDQLTAFAARQVFVAWSPEYGRELWITDGTQAGTRLVADINPGPASSEPAEIVPLGDLFLFSADDGEHGRELWRSDGTATGTALVADISPERGNGLTTQSLLAATNAGFLFVAYDPEHGRELWRTDGTGPGTMLVADIEPGFQSAFSFGAPIAHAEVGGVSFFVAEDGQHGTELWESDGTAAGTYMVGDIFPGSAGSFPRSLVAGDDTVFFLANDGTLGYELWAARTGAEPLRLTAAGAEPVGASPLAPPSYLTYAGGLLYFDGPDLEIGRELWRSDGTPDGTFPLRDIRSGSEGSFPNGMTAFAGRVFFSANADDSGGRLWVTDGTAQGTVPFAHPGDAVAPQDFHSTQDLLFFLAYSDAGIAIWRSDGTAGGTFPLVTFANGDVLPPAELTTTADLLFFAADDGTHGPELWRSDGTVAGTLLVRDIRPGAEGSLAFLPFEYPELGDRLTPLADGRLLFRADDGTHGRELWISDGGGAGLVANIARDDLGLDASSPEELTSAGRYLYFSAIDGEHGRELWRSDGTEDGTLLVRDLYPGPDGGDPASFTALDTDRVLFAAADAEHGRELWLSDGSAAGTQLVADIDAFGSSAPQSLVNVGGRVFFTADDGTRGRELWISDGTEDGTRLLRDINPNGSASSAPELGPSIDGQLYFTADDGEHGRELWHSDGTADGTRMLLDLYAGPLSGVSELVAKDDQLFFVGNDGTGNTIWRSDGSGDAEPVTDVLGTRGLTVAGDRLFYFAGAYDLWTFDLTTGENTFLRNLHPASGQASPGDLRAVNGILLFRAGTSNAEVWTSDGTTDGTQMILGGLDRTAIRATGQVVFSRDGEVWLSNADFSMPRLLADIAPGAAASHPGPFVEHDGLVFFAADDQMHGRELWALPISAFTGPCPGDCDGDRHVSVAEIVLGLNIALGRQPLDACSAFDSNVDGQIGVADLVAAVRANLENCSPAA